MKRILFYLFFLLIGTSTLVAQTFIVPDSNFFNALLQTQPNCSTCVANYATREFYTACIDSLNITSLIIPNKNINNLQGVQYFVDLLNLYCYNINSVNKNNLTNLPTLPNTLTQLHCYGNQLTNLPTLPNNLISLRCENNQLTNLPVLPNSLTEFMCSNNQLINLPTLPNNLVVLRCESNQLTNLSSLPNTLTQLHCNNNLLTILPTLPTSLFSLYCNNNQLISLPLLPSSLTQLYCNNNQLSNFPPLPNSLTLLWCQGNQLMNLPTLPNNLTQLNCYGNQLTSLPTLPNSLSILECQYNQLISLPFLPNNITQINCNSNQLTSLPALPTGLIQLRCGGNQLTNLPILPNSLSLLWCYENQLNSLPALPNSLTTLDCSANKITQLPSFANNNNLYTLICSCNQLTSLPTLPNNVTSFNCGNNLLRELPRLPNSMTTLNFGNGVYPSFNCGNNFICCLPNMPNSLTNLGYNNNYVTCLPNYNTYITAANSGLPLCDSSNTPSQCAPLATAGMSETFPLTGIRQIIHDTLYLPFTTPAIDIVDYEKVIYQKTPTQKDTLMIFGGDIVLGKPQQIDIRYGNPSPTSQWLWEGKIPYNPVGITDSIYKAIQYFNVRAGLMGLRIAFVPKQITDTDFITFVHSKDTYASYIGRIGGEQYIWADTAGFTGKILHELTHVCGIYHEHQRDSAQFYVNIQNQYIKTAFADAFCRIKDIQLTPYDYNSIMHYVCFAFSTLLPLDGVNLFSHQNTLLPTQIMNDAEMGQRSDYTNYDIADINQIYPDGIIGGIGPLGTGIYTLLLPSYLGQSYTVTWSIYNTEPLVYIGNTYNISIQSTTFVSGLYKATLFAPQPINAPHAARGFVVATVTFSNGTIKKFYKYVYRN